MAVDETFTTAQRIQLDNTSWIDHIQGWLTGGMELMGALMQQADWEQRSRWMYNGMQREALYTDTYQRRDGEWMCIAGEVVAKGE